MIKESIHKSYEFSTILGIIGAILLIFIAIAIDSNITKFINVPSILIVVLGTFLITIAGTSIIEIFKSNVLMWKIIITKSENPSVAAVEALKMATYARTEGVEKLEQNIKKKKFTSFALRAIEMLVDKVGLEEIERLYMQSIYATTEQQKKVISLLRKSGEIAPAMGLIGTLIGLVQMLSQVEDISKIGPAMALALLTTFYGTIMSYVICFPLASKIESKLKEDMIVYNIYLKAIISIAKKENPRALEKELNSILSPLNNIKYFD